MLRLDIPIPGTSHFFSQASLLSYVYLPAYMYVVLYLYI